MVKWLKTQVSIIWLKALITLVALAAIIVRIVYPDIRIDAITLALLIVAILPWFSELIESAKFPGGWEIKFRDVREAGAKVTEAAPTTQPLAPTSTTAERPSFVVVAERDPNLALVGLRIEIERRIREFAHHHNLDFQRPLSQLLRDLVRIGALQSDIVGGLQELVSAGNQAAHGARVQEGIADWAIDVGPRILATLDERLATYQHAQPQPS